MNHSNRHGRNEDDRNDSRGGWASCRRLDSPLFGLNAKTYTAPPQTCRQVVVRLNLPLTACEVRDIARRGYIDEATADEIVERGGLW